MRAMKLAKPGGLDRVAPADVEPRAPRDGEIQVRIAVSSLNFHDYAVVSVTVGSRAQQSDIIAAIEATGIEPVIDSSFPLEALADAFRHQEPQQHFGKICVDV
jgi:NADPH:quinone reductase-like Zn-dependent oxidoreductase